MKIFTSTQLHELDKYTIEKDQINSIDLMERSAKVLTMAITEEWTDRTPVVIFAGPGNNGGDALAVGRLLLERGYHVKIYLFNTSKHLSPDCAANLQRLRDDIHPKTLIEVTTQFDPPELPKGTVVIDGLFGSGLNKPLTGGFASLVKYINQCPATVVSIDLPSGLMAEDNTFNVRSNIIRADLTLTLHQKKLSFFFADNQQFIGRVRVLDIRLSQQYAEQTDARYALAEEALIRAHIRHRGEFVNKGMMGHALLVAGSYGMAGASILASRACMRAGVGKLSVATPRLNSAIMQISVPEAVLRIDEDNAVFSEAIDATDYDALAIGPGLGQQETTAIAMITQIRRTQCPIVADADALNILSAHRTWMQQLPKGMILTPHPREFDRLLGATPGSDYERLQRCSEMAKSLHAYIILKGHYSALCLPDGHVIFNTTGNSGMATAGSGDVLTGILLGLLARGYQPADAAMMGMYLHGLAGDLAAKALGKESLIASDLIEYLPQAFMRLSE